MKKRSRSQITDSIRKEICNYAQKLTKKKHQPIADFFNDKYSTLNIDKSTISKVLKEKDW